MIMCTVILRTSTKYNKYCCVFVMIYVQAMKLFVMRREDPKSAHEHITRRDAHDFAWEAVEECVRDSVIQQRKVVSLSSLLRLFKSTLDDYNFASPTYRADRLLHNITDRLEGAVVAQNVDSPTRGAQQDTLIYAANLSAREAVVAMHESMPRAFGASLHDTLHKAMKATPPIKWPFVSSNLTVESGWDMLPAPLRDFILAAMTGSVGKHPLAGLSKNAAKKVQTRAQSIGQDFAFVCTGSRWILPKQVALAIACRHWHRARKPIVCLNRFGHCISYDMVLDWEKELAARLSHLEPGPLSKLKSGTLGLVARWIDNGDFKCQDGTMANLLMGCSFVVRGLGSILTTKAIAANIAAEINIPDVNVNSTQQDRTKTHRIAPYAANAGATTRAYLRSGDVSIPKHMKVDLGEHQRKLRDAKVASRTLRRRFRLWVSLRHRAGLSDGPAKDIHVPSLWAWWTLTSDDHFVEKVVLEPTRLITAPITSFKGIRQALLDGQKQAHLIGMPYDLVWMDCGAYMKVAKYVFSWNSLDTPEFPNTILGLAPFHAQMTYASRLTALIENYGFETVLLDARIVAPGTVKGFKSGRNWELMMKCHLLLTEAIDRWFMLEFLKDSGNQAAWRQFQCAVDCHLPDPTDVGPKSKKSHRITMTADIQAAILEDPAVTAYFDRWEAFMQDAANPDDPTCGGQNGSFLSLYLESAWPLLQMELSVRDKDFQSYVDSAAEMLPLFHSLDGTHMARWGTFHSVLLTHQDSWWPGSGTLMSKTFTVNTSTRPGCARGADMAGEVAVMKPLKSAGRMGESSYGAAGLAKNKDKLARFQATMSYRAEIANCCGEMANVRPTHATGTYNEISLAAITASEDEFSRVLKALNVFGSPLQRREYDNDDNPVPARLVCLESGRPAPSEVTMSLLSVRAKGHQLASKFVEERFRIDGADPAVPWEVKVKKLKLKTFKSLVPMTKVKTSKGKTVSIPRTVSYLWRLITAFATKFNKTSGDGKVELLKDIAGAPLGDFPDNLANDFGELRTRNKATFAKSLIKSAGAGAVAPTGDSPPPHEVVNVVDGNAFYHAANIGQTSTYGDVAYQMFIQPGHEDEPMCFIADRYYDVQAEMFLELLGPGHVPTVSNKAAKRSARGVGSETTAVRSANARRPVDWVTFVANDQNKVGFGEMMYREWTTNHQRYVDPIKRRGEVYLSIVSAVTGSTTLVTVTKEEDGDEQLWAREVPDTMSTHEEFDNIAIQHVLLMRDRGYKLIRVTSPDSDLLFLLAFHATRYQDVQVHLVMGNLGKQSVIDIHKFRAGLNLTDEMWEALLVFQIECGVDTTSATYGRRIDAAFKKLRASPVHVTALASIGRTWDAQEADYNNYVRFVVGTYGLACSDMNDARAQLIHQQCTGDIRKSKPADFRRLPAPDVGQRMHFRRVNYQARLWRLAPERLADIESPTADDGARHGWSQQDDGSIVARWYPAGTPSLPTFLTDAIDISQPADDEDDDASEHEDDDSSFNGDSDDDDDYDVEEHDE